MTLQHCLHHLKSVISQQVRMLPLRIGTAPTVSYSSVPCRHHIWISTCHDIYSNLALEDWLYTQMTFDQRELFLLWSNDPCIVIGRHQNPWAECHVSAALSKKIDIARRNSGGGTVYHDKGNLCCSFFTTRKQYNRRKNLEQVVSALNKNFDLNVAVSDRDDILLDGKYKISGTAAKLGRQVAYHHCTVLLDVDTSKLQKLLVSPMHDIKTRATESVRSEVRNTCEIDSAVTYENVIAALVEEYQSSHESETELMHVDPTRERHFPGISILMEKLKDWDWIYGKTPPFTLQRTCSQILDGSTVKLSVKLDVEKGCMKHIDMQTNPDVIGQEVLQLIAAELKDKKFCFTTIDGAMRQFSQESSSHGQVTAWVWKCFNEIFR